MVIRSEIDSAIKRVLDSGQFILNKEVRAFEEAFAKFCDVKYAIGVANGTEALYIALKSLGVGPGDEVITVSHTASATACAITWTGAKPVYIDIEERSFLMNPELIEPAITKKTKAIVPVHLYGRMCDMIPIQVIADLHDIPVIEDCAQSVDAGGLSGLMGCYSFYPTKNLGAAGDGGCIVTNDAEMEIRCSRAREYGYSNRFDSTFWGMNSRLDEIQAAILNVKLRYLHLETARRRELASFYIDELKKTGLVLPQYEGVFHQFVVRAFHEWRDDLVKLLKAQVHYPVPCHKQEAYKSDVKLPVTEFICKEIVSLPMRISLEQAQDVCDKIKDYMQ